MNALSLLELNSLVKKTLSQGFPGQYWIQAELSDVRMNAAGHCYLEFVQKDARNHNLIAKARGNIWANVFRLIKPYFESTTGQAFVSGIKVLVKVTVEFHELYGYSLTVSDIDPTYTVGDMVRRRKEVLSQLEKEGILNLNKQLETPVLPQRIAVISSATAAGYDDFKHQLQNNSGGYYFMTELFPAVMQGDRVESSIKDSLERIRSRMHEFDMVVIIRGGGATSDLSCFDAYELAAGCARFPLPIITGIGHERDDTVLDSVAHVRVKTPTAAAEFLIRKVDEAASWLYTLTGRLKENLEHRISTEKKALDDYRAIIPNLVYSRLSEARFHLLNTRKDLLNGATTLITGNKHKLELLHQRINDASPSNILNKGYSLTLKDGKVVTDASQVKQGDEIITRLARNEITSTVK